MKKELFIKLISKKEEAIINRFFLLGKSCVIIFVLNDFVFTGVH